MKVTSLAVILCAVGGVSSVEIVVNYFDDGTGTAFGCGTVAEQCNLRSAWTQCHSYLDESCTVHLPFDSYHTLNATIGQLELEEGLDIAVLGNNSTVSSVGVSPPGETVTDNEDFPLQSGLLSGTNSASQNFATGCVEVCPLDMLRFSACDGDVHGDTYFRLFDSSGSEVAHDDDGCGVRGGASIITHSIPANSVCEQYCLHVGCYGSGACSADVTLQLVKAQAPARLFSFSAKDSNAAPSNSSLSLRGLAVRGFDSPFGGIVYASGDLKLTIRNCVFGGSSGLYGGAIYVTDNSLAVNIVQSEFNSTTAAISGGAIYIARDVTRLNIENCAFHGCSALGSGKNGGGAVYLGEGSHDAAIHGSGLWGCSAPRGSGGGIFATGSERLLVEDVAIAGCSAKVGGGVAFDTGCSDAVVRNVQVSQSSALSYGGAISLWETNQRVTMTGVAIDQCSAGDFGGGLFVLEQNNFLLLSNTNITRCSARTYNGGGVYLEHANLNVTLEAVAIRQCSAASGGGVSLYSANAYLTMRGVDITGCTAGYGGGIYAYDDNPHVEVYGATVEDCSATSSGGGIYLDTANEHVQLTAVRINRCIAEHSGGGLFANNQNSYMSLSNVSVMECRARAGDGGGVRLYQSNLYVTMEAVAIERCSAASGGGVALLSGNAHLSMRDVAIRACTVVYYGGGIFLYSANEHAHITAVHIDQCSANVFGGGMFAQTQNNFLSLSDVNITRCSARNNDGGGVYLYQANLNVSMQDVTIADCTAPGWGGGVQIGQGNLFFVLRSVRISRCAAGYGGGLTIYSDNTHAEVDGLLIEDCGATRPTGHGGGLMIHEGNHFLSLRNLEIARCEAYQGAGLELEVKNLYVRMEAVVVKDCWADEFGGGILVVSGNDYLVLKDVRVTACGGGNAGGGVVLDVENKHVQLVGVTIDSCFTSGPKGMGGGLYVSTQNDYLSLSDVYITGCRSAHDGGGIHSLRNDGLTIMDSRIEHCSADRAGGGQMLSNAHVKVAIVNSSISYNTAQEMGGGVASLSDTRDLVVTGCVLCSNEAYGQFGQGGGIYLGTGHFGFALLNEASYRHREVIESAHPYEYSPQVLIDRIVAAPGATGYYVYFDPLSKIAVSDSCILGAALDEPTSRLVLFARSLNWPGIHGPPLHWPQESVRITCTTFLYPKPTAATDNYYGVKLHVVPVFAGVEGATVLEGNTAGEKGGGLYMASREQSPILVGTQFRNNQAGSDGGGMYLRNEVIGMVAHQLVMEGNRALDGYGGGMCASTGCYAMQAQNCTFTNNSAGYAGGALAFVSDNGVYGDMAYGNDNVISSSSFLLNSAMEGGGGVYLGTHSDLTVLSSVVRGNAAYGDGGGVMLSEKSRLTASHLTVSQNRARECGGGMALEDSCTATVSNSVLSSNVAVAKGGAFCAKDGSLLDIAGTEIVLNSAGRVGGALYCADSPYPVMWETAIDENAAKWGSALYLDGVVASINNSAWGVSVTRNQATVGTVYWVNGTMPQTAVFAAGFSFEDNTVLFGQEVATQATALRVPERIIVEQYGAFLDRPAELTLVDRYGELSPASESAYVGVSILEESTLQCNGRPPFLSGTDVSASGVAWREGVAVFGSLGVTCYPGSNVTLLFTAHLADQVDLPAVQQIVSATAELHFRSCRVGEFIDNGKCAVCPSGSYSLDEAVSEATRCKECPSKSEVESCHGADIVLQQRHWRRHAYSEAILPCLDDVDGCAGGNTAGDASCREGYEGPLCSVCTDGYYLNDAQCQSCTNSDSLAPASMLYVAIAAVVVVAAVMAVLFYKSSRMYSGDASSVWESLYNVVSWLIDELQSLQSQIKILITTFQICTTVHVSMKVTFPVQFTRYLNAMSVVNLNVVALVPLSCAARANYTFIDKLVMVTLGPIALSLLIALIGAVEYQRCAYRSRGDDNMTVALNKVTSRYLTMFLFLTYLVLPYVATTIFQTFLCTDVGSSNEDGDAHDRYLTADMRISCDSHYYRSGVGYASVMAVLYVGGIPLMYALLLYRSRNEIAGRFTAPSSANDSVVALNTIDAAKADAERADVSLAASDGKDNDNAAEEPVNHLEKRTDPAALQARMISFLYEAYEPQYWYWEVVETTRRLVLTAVLSVCGAGTGGQAVLALLLALLYIKLVGYYRPYLENMDDIEAEVGQYQIFLTFLGALICQRHLVGSEYDSAVSGVMLAINTAVSIMFTRNVLLKLREDVKNLRNLAQVFPKLASVSGSFAVADAEKDSEHGLELPAFGNKGGEAVVGVLTAVGTRDSIAAAADDAIQPFEAGDQEDGYSEVEVWGAAEDVNSGEFAELGEEVV
jgi:uncharacterized membrane protein YidH (DUF202 family)